jgi:Uri superfamily endonuclease
VTEGGTYTLLVELPTEASVEFGAAGTRQLEAGWYAYVGSALGSGGFSRVDRHRRLASGEKDTRHWHVDYLLGRPEARIDEVVHSEGVDAECEVATGVRSTGEPVPGIGATDCGCGSHLVYAPDHPELLAGVTRAHDRAGESE